MQEDMVLQSQAHLISVDDALSQIVQVADLVPLYGHQYFLMTGAGVSRPQVPLANQMAAECRQVAAELGRDDFLLSQSMLDQYSHWLERAYPHPTLRQLYLKSLISDQSIPKAALRLAHILGSKRLTNLLVTTNFDDFTERAMSMFGFACIVCDHPLLVDRVDIKSDDLQVVHVHGTYWFYDCCNLKPEVKERADVNGDPATTMASLLSSILATRVPIVVGYSGWEDDVFMDALRRRLTGRRLPYNLLWFCYQLSDIQSLPAWLLNHPDVRFVLSEDALSEASVLNADIADEGVTDYDSDQLKEGHAATTSKGTLPAQQVFDELIRALELEQPLALADPLEFYAQQLDQCLSEPTGHEADEDIYLLHDVVQRIRRAKALEEEKSVGITQQLELMRSLIRSSKYSEATDVALKINLELLNEEQLSSLETALPSLARNASDLKSIKLLWARSIEAANLLHTRFQHLEALTSEINHKLSLAWHLKIYEDKQALSFVNDALDAYLEVWPSNVETHTAFLGLRVQLLFDQRLYGDVDRTSKEFYKSVRVGDSQSMLWDLTVVQVCHALSLEAMGENPKALETLLAAEDNAEDISDYTFDYWLNTIRESERRLRLKVEGPLALLRDINQIVEVFEERDLTRRPAKVLQLLCSALENLRTKNFEAVDSDVAEALTLDHERPLLDTETLLATVEIVGSIGHLLRGDVKAATLSISFTDARLVRLSDECYHLLVGTLRSLRELLNAQGAENTLVPLERMPG